MAAPTHRLVASHALAAVAMAMPWPALLAATWVVTGSEVWLGVVGAVRMAPYVGLSWLAGSLGDRLPRLRLLRAVTWLRAVLLTGCAVLLAADQVAAAVVVATLVVAVGTPAYPALAAAVPALAGRRSDQVTSLLVTAEVSAFVVGPAIGGLLLGPVGGLASVQLAAALAVGAALLLPGAGTGSGPTAAALPVRGLFRVVVRSPGAVRAMVAVAVVNAVEAALGLALFTLAVLSWRSGATDFGLATAALGFGALGAPVLHLLARGLGVAVLLTACGLVAVALSPSVVPALLPLALVGTAGTQVECEATAVLQREVPDRARAFALGLADTVMVSAAMVGAALAPWLAVLVGPRVLVLGLGLVALALLPLTRAAAVRRPSSEPYASYADRHPVPQPDRTPAG